MSAWIAAGAAISATASLLGGRADRKAQKEANDANRPSQQVKEWEAAGINPVMGITQGQWVPHQAASMGDSFANAGSAIANGMALHHQDQVRETELAQENEKLRETIVELGKPTQRSHLSRFGASLPVPDDGEEDDFTIEDSRLDGINSLYFGDDLDRLRSRDFDVAGSLLNVNEETAPASVVEEEYGDFTGGLYGFVKSGADVISNIADMSGVDARVLGDNGNPFQSIVDRNQRYDEFYDNSSDVDVEQINAFRADRGLPRLTLLQIQQRRGRSLRRGTIKTN